MPKPGAQLEPAFFTFGHESIFEKHGQTAEDDTDKEQESLRAVFAFQKQVHQLAERKNTDDQADAEGDEELPFLLNVMNRIGQNSD